MLSVSFARTDKSMYFSTKLKDILSQALDHFGSLKPQPLIWLAIASQVANDSESYSFAHDHLNKISDNPLQLLLDLKALVRPTMT